MAERRSVIALSRHNKLYVDTALVAADCNSFAVHRDFLIFATNTYVCSYLQFYNCRMRWTSGTRAALCRAH